MITIQVEKTASEGIGIGKAFLLHKTKLSTEFGPVSQQDIPKEIRRYEQAVEEAQAELAALAESNAIFQAHLEMVKDITLYEGVITRIKEEGLCAEAALHAAAEEFIAIFDSMEDEYMRERAADIKDVRFRLMCLLQGVKVNPFDDIREQVILIAEDLAPSDTATMPAENILGIITQEGGVTSHVSIMAKNLGIPALVGVKEICSKVKTDDTIIMDAKAGVIYIQPDDQTLKKYCQLQRKEEHIQKERLKLKELPPVTKDGKRVRLCINAGRLHDIKKAMEYGPDGVGLFRSEFLYMDNTHFPTEEEQFKAYKSAALLSCEELTIRTLDIGGDKALPYYIFEKEENPFLGWRAIRISLELIDRFKTQLRAILRASVFGMVRLMFPMIISLEELRRAKEILAECMRELEQEGLAYDPGIKVGMMIETPASVVMIEDFAREVDFFSIGTNDLTQYLLAVDRGNKKIAAMYNSFHPAVLRSIRRIIEAGHRCHIPVGMCGEFAGEEKAVKLLLGMGLDEFSVSGGGVLKLKELIREADFREAKQLAGKVCEKQTIQEVYELLGIEC